MVRETGRFRARADNGRECTLIEYTEFLQSDSMEESGGDTGLKSYKLPDGTKVKRSFDGMFKIHPFGPVVRRVS
jgi:hypothetical protein